MKDINIKNLAELAKLSLTEGELNLLEVDVLKVLNAFEAISTVDTSNLEPMFNMVNENMKLREDKSEVWNE